MDKTTFKPDDKVTWASEVIIYDALGYKAVHGVGPFTIKCTREVDTRCTCGAGNTAPHHPHYEQCGVNNIKSVGHHQLIKLVEFGDYFSGVYFQLVP